MKALCNQLVDIFIDAFDWALNHTGHTESWRKAGIFMLTVSVISFMQLSLVIMPIEKEGQLNHYETEKIEQMKIDDILEHDCELKSAAYTQCSTAKYLLNNIKILLPIFYYTSFVSFIIGAMFLILYGISGLNLKVTEFLSWSKAKKSDSRDL